jgi:hypothetical protein
MYKHGKPTSPRHIKTGWTTKRFTWKWFGGGVGTSWASFGGKYIKRMLHKAERRAAKDELHGRKPRKSVVGWNTEANWKGW